jgi:hypothetical protein
MTLSGLSDAKALFQQSAILSVTLTLTFHSLSVLESQFSKTWRHKAILRGKGDSGLLYSGIDGIRVSHHTETEKSWKVKLIRKAILQICKLLKMVFCSSCDGVPLKFKRKTGGPPVYQHRLFELIIDPS